VTVQHIQSFPKGTILFSAGEPAAAAYVILEGKALATQGSNQVALGPGGFLGAVAFFQEREHSYTALCATELKALILTKENLREVAARQPGIALALLRELALQVPQTEGLVFIQGRQEERGEQLVPADFLPEGHPVFEGSVPVKYGELVFPVEVNCRACGHPFTGMRVRVSRLQLAEQKPDFRNIYRNFEPNYYYFWVCPHCLFAYPERLYNRVSERAALKWKAASGANPGGAAFEFSVPRTIHEAIISYYLAMRTYEVIGASSDLWGNLWLRLVWIYEDLGARELALQAAEKARMYFAESLSTTARSAAGDQRLYLILGELDLRLGHQGEAFRNFHAAATMSGGDPRLKRMASDRIQDLRTR
jgi:uncharacterized protein (DUF2225 family)